MGLNPLDQSLELLGQLLMGQHFQVWFLPVPFLESECSAYRSLCPPVHCPLWSVLDSDSSQPNPYPELLPERRDLHLLIGTILLSHSRNLKALVCPSRGLARVLRQRPNSAWSPCLELAWLNLGFLVEHPFLESRPSKLSAKLGVPSRALRLKLLGRLLLVQPRD